MGVLMIQSVKIFLSLGLIFMAVKLGASKAAWAFLLVGAIPGTSYSVPAGTMFFLFAGIVWLLFCQSTVNYYAMRLFETSRRMTENPAPRMPRRRFGQI